MSVHECVCKCRGHTPDVAVVTAVHGQYVEGGVDEGTKGDVLTVAICPGSGDNRDTLHLSYLHTY